MVQLPHHGGRGVSRADCCRSRRRACAVSAGGGARAGHSAVVADRVVGARVSGDDLLGLGGELPPAAGAGGLPVVEDHLRAPGLRKARGTGGSLSRQTARQPLTRLPCCWYSCPEKPSQLAPLGCARRPILLWTAGTTPTSQGSWVQVRCETRVNPPAGECRRKASASRHYGGAPQLVDPR